MTDSTPNSIRTPWGRPLTEKDYKLLSASWIPRELADAAGLRRVDSAEGGQIIGGKGSADYTGLIFPYRWPGDNYIREYRLRCDNPELEPKADGSYRERNKYLSPPGRGNLLYFVLVPT